MTLQHITSKMSNNLKPDEDENIYKITITVFQAEGISHANESD